MKVSDLKKQLESCDPNMEIDVVVSITEHYCGADGYCYCTAEDKHFDVNGISKQTVYDKKTKKQKVVGFSITTY